MDVLIVNNFVREVSGTNASVELEEAVLAERGHHVEVFGRDNRLLDSTAGLRRAALLASCLYSLPVRNELETLLAQRRFDVAHVHNLVPLITSAVFDAARKRELPAIQHLHSLRSFCLNSYSHRSGRYCDLCTRTAFLSSVWFRCYHDSSAQSAMLVAARWIDIAKRRPFGFDAFAYRANSEFTKRRHVEYGLPAERIWVVPNSTENLALQCRERAPRWSRPKRKLAFLGAVLAEKGLPELLDLAARLPEFEVHVIGTGRDEAALRRTAAARRLANVTFHGFVGGRDRVLLWEDSFLTIAPSRVEETFGLIAPESYSLAIPVVASGAGALAETVRDGVTGFVRDLRDPTEVAALVTRLWGDPDRYRAMRESAHAEYHARYTPQVFGAGLDELQGRVMDEWREPPPAPATVLRASGSRLTMIAPPLLRSV